MKKIIPGLKTLFSANAYYFSYIAQNGKLLIFFQILYVFLNIPLNLVQLYAPKRFIDNIVNENHLWGGMIWIILLITAQLLYAIILAVITIYRENICANAKLKTKEHTYKHFFKLYLAYFDDKEKLNNIQRALAYGETGGTAFLLFLFSFFSLLSSFFTITYVSLTFDWWIWLIIIAVFLIRLFLGNRTKKLHFNFQKEKVITDRKLSYYTRVLSGKNTLPEVKIYGAAEFFLRKHRTAFYDQRKRINIFEIKKTVLAILEQLPDKILTLVSHPFENGLKP